LVTLQKKGIIAFTDGIKTIQNPRLMSRIMNSAKDIGCLIMQHAEDYELAKNGMINSGKLLQNWVYKEYQK
jgi:dihydroorotase